MHFKSFIILIISVLEHEDYDRIEVFIISKIVTGHLGFSRLSNWFSLFRTLNYGVTKKTEDSSNNLCSCVLLCWLQCWILLESVHQTGNVSNWRLDYLKCWAFANVFHAWFNQKIFVRAVSAELLYSGELKWFFTAICTRYCVLNAAQLSEMLIFCCLLVAS